MGALHEKPEGVTSRYNHNHHSEKTVTCRYKLAAIQTWPGPPGRKGSPSTVTVRYYDHRIMLGMLSLRHGHCHAASDDPIIIVRRAGPAANNLRPQAPAAPARRRCPARPQPGPAPAQSRTGSGSPPGCKFQVHLGKNPRF
eukprot:254089-Hanusia_phi.AAC.1